MGSKLGGAPLFTPLRVTLPTKISLKSTQYEHIVQPISPPNYVYFTGFHLAQLGYFLSVSDPQVVILKLEVRV